MSALAGQWFRVARLQPSLRAHAQVHRHVARRQIWYVLQDHQTGRFFRISPAANLMLCLMNGRRTMEDIWNAVADRLGSAQPTKDEAVRLMIQLHQADLLRTGLPPDMAELERRADRHDRGPWRGWFASPMAMRFPLLDPDRFLDATMPLLRPVFTRAGLVVWLALVATGFGLAALHWTELADNVSDRVFASYNVVMLLLLYPVSKVLHELGHAYATKAGGGRVHEVGLMLLVFFPVPYVDATASSAFPDRWRRVLIGSAGIMVELALAALAMIAWVELSPGLARAAAFNLLLLCSVSTLVFNANPLLRFDGYYVLGDLLDIHNLDQRARRYLMYLLQRLVLGMHAATTPVQAPGEAKWLALYGVLSFLYRISMMATVAALVSQRYFALGMILAGLSVAQMLVWPIMCGLRFLLLDQALRPGRGRAVRGAAAVALAAGFLLLLLPLPYGVVADGVVWVPDDAVLHARADGFVTGLLVPDGSDVAPGQDVLALQDPVALAKVTVLRAQAAVAASRFDAVNLVDRVQARLADEQLAHARAALSRAEVRVSDLVLHASRAGRLSVPDAATLPGRFVHNGDALGYIIGGDVAVRAVLPQAEIDLIRSRTRGVGLRFADAVGLTVSAEILRETPSALERPPAAGLASEGGGPILTDPTSPHRDRPLDRWYEVIVRPTAAAPPQRIGGHVHVRFDLGAEPVAWRLLREARQAILRILDV